MNVHIQRLFPLLIEKRQSFMPADTCKDNKIFQTFEHFCVIMNLNGAPLAYGYNTYSNGDMTTHHAEAMAFRKLNCVRKQKGIRGRLSVNILVVRTNGSNSKPCNRCVNYMDGLTGRFNINNIYYTDQQEETGIRCVKFSKLLNEEERHICAYDRNIVRRYHGNPNDSLRSKSPQFINSIHQNGNHQVSHQITQVRCA